MICIRPDHSRHDGIDMTRYLETKPYKGTRDFYPDDMRIQKWMFDRLRSVVSRYGYQEYDGPMLEPFELYAAKTGEEIVNKQLYWLMDQGERKLAIRPEMTPTLARMVAGKFQELPRPIRWFSTPNLWRYERPQRGRLREHWQLNVDVLGGDAVLADSEILSLAIDLMKAFGGEKFIKVRVNNRRLMDTFFREKLALAPEEATKLIKALDSRDKIGEEAYHKWLSEIGIRPEQQKTMEGFFSAPFEKIRKDLPCQGSEELAELFRSLEMTGHSEYVVFDPMVLRGMDYYTGTVFEIYDVSPENRRAMFGGGRYDNLLALFGKYELSGVGFGMGDVTLRNFLETHALLPEFDRSGDVFVSLPDSNLLEVHQRIAASLRDAGFSVVTPLGVSGFGAQLKQANKLNASWAVLLGDKELSEKKVLVKNLQTGNQETLEEARLAEKLKSV